MNDHQTALGDQYLCHSHVAYFLGVSVSDLIPMLAKQSEGVFVFTISLFSFCILITFHWRETASLAFPCIELWNIFIVFPYSEVKMVIWSTSGVGVISTT